MVMQTWGLSIWEVHSGSGVQGFSLLCEKLFKKTKLKKKKELLNRAWQLCLALVGIH